MRIDIISIFPDYFQPLSLSLIGKAQQAGLVNLCVHDLRRWTTDRHHTVDDAPYGGGAGMVMKPEPWWAALSELIPAETPPPVLLIPTPSGPLFTQTAAGRLATEPHLLVACGRYEGIDARVAEYAATVARVEEFSLGDYVLNGGEVAALAALEAIIRLIPGVLGNPDSLAEESHTTGEGGLAGLLEYPVYTKPAEWQGRTVPEVLLSGHHGQIARWRRDQALRRTARIRPDLLARIDPQLWDSHDRQVLGELGWLEG